MPTNLPRYTLRISREYLKKMKYIAEENGRSTNKEIEAMIKNRIAEYETKNGVIPV